MREYIKDGLFLGHKILNMKVLEETRRGALVDVVYWVEKPKYEEAYINGMGIHIDWWKTLSGCNELEIKVAELRSFNLTKVLVYEPNDCKNKQEHV